MTDLDYATYWANQPLLDRLCGWLHNRAVLNVGAARLFHMGLLTEHCGPGRVLALSFLRGAGYIPHPGSRLLGFTVYVRLCASTDRTASPYVKSYPRFLVTTNPNNHCVEVPWSQTRGKPL